MLWDTLSVTSYYHDDVTTTFNATVQDSLTYNSWSESYSDETTGSSSSGGANNSVSFWGNGTDYSDSGWVVTDDSLSSGHSTLSSDGWSQVNSQYSGGNTSQYPASWDSHYSLSNDYSSGFQNSDDASASLAIAGGTSQSQLESFTDANTDETVTLSMNDLDGVLGYQGLGTEGNTTVASLSFSTSSDSSSTAGWNHSTSSTDSWNSSGDQLTDTLSYDGLGQSVSLHNLSIWTSVSNDESYHDDGGNTLSGSTTSVTDFWTHSEGSGTYSFGISTSPGVYSTWSSLWSNGDGQSSADFVSSDSGSIYGGWSDYSSGNDTWGSYDDEQSSGASTDGLGHSSTWSSTSQTLDGTESFGSHSETSTSLYGVVNDDTQDSSTQGRGTVTSVSDSSTTNGVSSLWVSTSYDGDAQWDGDNTDTYNATNTGGWNHSTSINDQWGSDDEVSSTTLSSGSAGNPVSASDSTLSEYSGESITTHGETSTSLSGGGSDTTTDFSSFNSGSLTSSSDSTLSNGLNSGWSSTSLDGNDNWTSDTSVSNNHAITGGWDHSTSSFDSWGSGGNLSTNYASSGGSGSPDNTISTSLTESSGDSTSLQDETSTALSGLSNDITSVSWISDTGSETLTNDSDSTSQDTLAFTSFGASGTRDLDWTDVQNSRTFSLSSLDDGNENYTHGYGSFYSYNDQSDLTAQTTGPYFSSVVSTSSDSTHTASGQDDTFADDQGSDTFSSMGYVGSTGTSTQDSGSEQFGFGQTYSDSYNDQTINHSSNDGHGHTSSSRAIVHSDQGSNGWSWNVDGSDTFGMTATDPSTGATSSDDGGENYDQGQTQTESFGDTSTSNSSTVNGSTTTLSTLTHTNGGTDTLSSGDQVGHLYGAVSFDPTTGDIASSTGSDNYDLGKNYSDTYTNLSIGATTTHSDSGFAGATYTDQGAETDLTTTTDPDTGDVSNDNNTDSFTEDDGSTESFTDQGWVTTGTTSTTHTDDGSDSVSSYDQDTDISSDTSNNGLSTAGTSDTSTESDSSSDSYGDQSSQVETGVGSSITVTNSTTYTDGGSDTDSTFDQGTDTSSDESADGLESDAASDTYTNTESSSDSYADQSFDFENVASGSVASASSSESSTDSGIDSTWSYDYGTDGTSSESEDGLESDLSADTYTNTVSSGDTTSDQSYDGESQVAGASLSATSSDSSTDSGTDSTFSYDYNTDTPSSASEDGTASDSSSVTETDTEMSYDEYSDQSYDSGDEAAGALMSSINSASGSEGERDTSSNVDSGGSLLETPTDVGMEFVTGTFSDSDTSSDNETDTSSDFTNNDQGTTTETQVATSDQTQTASSTETSSGTDSFTGVVENGSTYSGSGVYSDSSFDSNSSINHDDSDTTTDPSGLVNGSDASTESGTDTSGSTSQDLESLDTSDGQSDPVTVTALDSDSSINEADVVTSYSEGTPSEQGGTTLQVAESDTFTEADPQSSYEDVSADNSTDVTPAGQDTTGDSSEGGGGLFALATFAADGAPQNGGGSSGGGTDTQSGTLPGASPALNEVRGNLNPGGTPAPSQASAGITFSLAWVEAARDSGLLTTIHGPNMVNPAAFDSNPLSTYRSVSLFGGSMSQQALFSFAIDLNGKSSNVILAPVYVVASGPASGRNAASYQISYYRIVAVGPGTMTPEQFADSKFFDADLVRNNYILAGIATFTASLVPGFTFADSVKNEGLTWKATVSLAADVGTVLTLGSSRFIVAAGVALQLPAIGSSGYNLTQSTNAIEFGGNLGDVLLRLLVLKGGVVNLRRLSVAPANVAVDTVNGLADEVLEPLYSASRRKYAIPGRIVAQEVKVYVAENRALFQQEGGTFSQPGTLGPVKIIDGQPYRVMAKINTATKTITLYSGWRTQDLVEELVHFRQAVRDGFWGARRAIPQGVKDLWEQQADNVFKALGMTPR